MFSGKIDTLGDDVDAEAMEVLNELNLLSESEDQRQAAIKSESAEWDKCMYFFFFFIYSFVFICKFSFCYSVLKKNKISLPK